MQGNISKELLLQIAASHQHDARLRKEALEKLLEDETALQQELYDSFVQQITDDDTAVDKDKERIGELLLLKINEDINNTKATATTGRYRKLLIRYAAAAAILLAVIYGSAIYLQKSNNTPTGALAQHDKNTIAPSAQLDTVRNDGNNIQVFLLPDSSTVSLFPKSQIIYNNNLYMKKDRALALSGKAIFDVHHLSGKQLPFFVDAGGIRILDVSTVFSVEYTNGKVISQLIKGKIIIQSLTGTFKDIALDQPQQQFNFDEQKQQFQLTDNTTTTPATPGSGIVESDNMLAFSNVPLQEVMEKIGQQHGFKISCSNAEKMNQLFTGTFSNEENIQLIMKKLALSTGMKYKIKGKTITTN
ncbi:FecR family protein [Chitinophaga sp. Cy-1792]|uniref:FecR family protein n=1 Tax=Chitinophaga sp. Cy-1792 TaxID=2608339 RepID=UPI00141F476B|nr:FecR family protein [Chitinophaga sp. Cy-1792]NIG53260.1 FecR family protein [Chitinophaga sp. Cy-1792]